VENADIVITKGNEVEKDGEVMEEDVEVFKGYANVIPIRGKDSSQDYYLMVLSSDLFA
jgi:hypothetical protein